jgi:hypothetical protein
MRQAGASHAESILVSMMDILKGNVRVIPPDREDEML